MLELSKKFDILRYFSKAYEKLLCKGSNFYKLMKAIELSFRELKGYINDNYRGLYLCESSYLIDMHIKELQLSNIFSIEDIKNKYRFTYDFPLPFGDPAEFNYNIEDIRKDLIVKKYLMNDNSVYGMKRILAMYCLVMDYEVINESNKFTYNFPIDFNDKENGVYITIKGTDIEDNELLKIKIQRIFEYMKPIHLTYYYSFENVTFDCDESDYFTYTFPIGFGNSAKSLDLKICGNCDCNED